MRSNRTVRDLGEKRIIREIIAPLCGELATGLGVGDDAALVDVPSGESLVISSDKIPEDLIALEIGLMDSFEHGRYLSQTNLSDIAAMGGKPLGLLVTLALPDDFSVDYLEEFMRGVVAGGAECDTPVIGGDVGWGSAPCLSATAIGSVQKDRALKRSGAGPGDSVFVTGPVGGFGTALAYFVTAKQRGLLLDAESEEYLKRKLTKPMARVETGRILAESGVCTACMDITDGVSQTLFELSEASGVSFLIDEDRIPIAPMTNQVANFLGVQSHEIIFGIGLDLELAGTVTCDAAALPDDLRDCVTLIGTVHDGHNNLLRTFSEEVIPVPRIGWQHFSGRAMDLIFDKYDKRATEKERDWRREKARLLRDKG